MRHQLLRTAEDIGQCTFVRWPSHLPLSPLSQTRTAAASIRGRRMQLIRSGLEAGGVPAAAPSNALVSGLPHLFSDELLEYLTMHGSL